MEKTTIPIIQKKKKNKEPIVALTCYDAFTAKLLDICDVDIALVGDSLANTRLGYKNTLPVGMDEMLHHVRSCSRSNKKALLVADMPFQSYEWAPWEAAKSAGAFVKRGGAQAVKVEGGRRVGESIAAILKANIPVMGHLGLTPQSVHHKGGYHVQGRGRKAANDIIADARYLQKCGVFSLVLEGVPAPLARKITKMVKIPTIGIGAGPDCDGQILVMDDMLGMTEGPMPRFVKKFANIRPLLIRAIRTYRRDVKNRRYPSKNHSY